MAVTEVRRRGSWRTPSTGVATPPVSGDVVRLISCTIPTETIRANDVTVNTTVNKPVWHDTYIATDRAALEVFTPTARAQEPPAGIRRQSRDSYIATRNYVISRLTPDTTYFIKQAFTDEAGARLVDVIRSFKTLAETTTGGGTTGPIAGDGTGPKLKWRPPAGWERFTPWNVKAGSNYMDPKKDYILIWPNTPIGGRGGVKLYGGRNVVSFGGHIHLPQWYSTDKGSVAKDNRALYIEDRADNCVMHIEGLLCSGFLAEGCDISCNSIGNTIQFANVLFGSESAPLTDIGGTHADAVQAWDGPHILRLDGVTSYSTYQHYMCQQNAFANRVEVNGVKRYYENWNVHLRNVQMVSFDSGKYAIWRASEGSHPKVGGGETGPARTEIDNVWLKGTTRLEGGGGESERSLDTVKQGFSTAIAKTPAQVGIGYVSPGYL